MHASCLPGVKLELVAWEKMATVESTIKKFSSVNFDEADDGQGWASPPLAKNLGLLSAKQIELARMLIEEAQQHLFAHWPEPGIDDEKKKAFLTR